MDDDNPPDPVLTPGQRFAILKAQIRQETLLEAAAACDKIAEPAKWGMGDYVVGFAAGASVAADHLRAMANPPPPTQH